MNVDMIPKLQVSVFQFDIENAAEDKWVMLSKPSKYKRFNGKINEHYKKTYNRYLMDIKFKISVSNDREKIFQYVIKYNLKY